MSTMKQLLCGISAKKEDLSIEKIHLEKIVPDPTQPRVTFDGLAELAETIQKHGLQNPIHVRPEGDKHVIISGERRWRACKEFGALELIPCFIHREVLDEQKIRYLQLIENLQRKDLSPLEEARAYQSLLASGHLTQKDLAAEVGLDKTVISGMLRLLSLSPELQEEIGKHPEVPKSLLLEIAREDDPQVQRELWERLQRGELTKRDELRQERKERGGIQRKTLSAMNEDEIWELLKRLVRKDKSILKKLLNAVQFEKLLHKEDEPDKPEEPKV